METQCPISAAAQRLDSIDAFRGLTMTSMLLCNFLSDGIFHVDQVPSLLRHAMQPNTMTLPDLIWPAFAFLMGVSFPLAVEKREKNGQSAAHIAWHVVIRSLTLMILGIFIGNAWESNGQGHPIGMNTHVWRLLTIVSFALIWTRYSSISERRKRWAIIARTVGVALLVYLAAIYREGDDLHGLQVRWWILGTLGWAYLVGGFAYLLFRNHREAIVGCLALAVLVYVGNQDGAFDNIDMLDPLRKYVPFGRLLGVWPAMVLGGQLVGMLFTQDSSITTPRRRLAWIGTFALGLFAAGYLLRPLYGCWKGTESPTWALYSVAISCVLFAGFYLLVDVWHKRTWVAFLLPVGTNALLAYLLHETLHPLLPLLNIRFESDGIMGIVRSALFAFIVLAITTYCTNRRILRLAI